MEFAVGSRLRTLIEQGHAWIDEENGEVEGRASDGTTVPLGNRLNECRTLAQSSVTS